MYSSITLTFLCGLLSAQLGSAATETQSFSRVATFYGQVFAPLSKLLVCQKSKGGMLKVY